MDRDDHPGRTGLSRFALGVVADRVVRGGRVPVLLLQSFASAQADIDLRRALVPLDGSSLAEKALDLIVELAGPVVQEITLLRAVDPRDGSEGLRQAESYLESGTSETALWSAWRDTIATLSVWRIWEAQRSVSSTRQKARIAWS